MKKIIFEKLIIKNFLSIGSTPVVVSFKPGLHGITGINRDQIDRRNGVGKSTIPDAMHFALFGTTVRELKKEFIINNITGQTCEVSLSFTIASGKKTDQYEIVRTLEPSRCYLFHNQRDITRDSIANTTEYIATLIGCNAELFQNCVIMTVNNTVPFMAKKKLEKRKFIESIFNLEIFSKMLSKLREEQSEIKTNYDIETTRQEEVQKSINTLVEQQEKSHQDYLNRKTLLEKRKIDNDTELSLLEKKASDRKELNTEEIIKNVALLTTKIETCDGQIKDIGKQIATLETTNEFCFTTMSKMGTTRDVCPTCLRPVTDHDQENIKQIKTKLKQEITDREQEIKMLDTKISELTILKTKINDAIKTGQNNINHSKLQKQQQDNDQKRILQLIEYNKQVEQDLQHITDTSSTLTTTIEETKTKLNELTERVTSLKRILNLMDTVKFVVSEEGVKSFIVKRILDL
jgi:DNA repair exonuclease SbcCD ATPase subunit